LEAMLNVAWICGTVDHHPIRMAELIVLPQLNLDFSVLRG
jgi:hypothetical protein